MRVFIAAEIDEKIKNNLFGIQECLRNASLPVKWVRPDNIHITLKFLGEIRETALVDVCLAVDEVLKDRQSFDIRICGMGVFPDLRRPRVVWVGIEDLDKCLAGLAYSIDNALCRIGFKSEKRKFVPHLTIGRVRSYHCADVLEKEIQNTGGIDLGKQLIDKITIMQSILGPKGPAYSCLKKVILQ